MLGLPETPQKILTDKYNSQETQVMNEGNAVFFIDSDNHPPDGVVYPPEGGVLVYKYGGIVKPVHIDPLKYTEQGEKALKELNELLIRHDCCLIGNDRQPAMLMPNEIVRLENSQKIEERVDLLYPEKGFPDPLAVSLANKVKRTLKVGVDFFTYKWTMVAFIGFLFLPFRYKVKVIEKWLDGWSGFAELTLLPRLMLPRYYTAFSRELMKFVEVLLLEIGISERVAKKCGWMIAEIIERDSAYRFRLEDLASEVSVEMLIKNPRQELKKVLELLKTREQKSKKLVKTFESFAKLAALMTHIPRLRKAFNKALRSVEFKNFQLDEIDKYQVLKYRGYDFFGMPFEARYQTVVNMHNGNPPKFGYVQI